MKLYHGTSSQWLPKIRNEGIKPRGRSKGNWSTTIESNPNAVYLTDAYPLHFAEKARGDKKHPSVVFEIDTDKLNPFLFAPDEDFLEQATRNSPEFPEIKDKSMHERTKWFRRRAFKKYKYLFDESLKGLGTCCYYGIIPPKAITRYALIEPKAPLKFMSDPSISLMNYKIMGEYYRTLVRHLFNDPLPEIKDEVSKVLGLDKLAQVPRDGIFVTNLEVGKDDNTSE
jgi:hypothetical protein